MGPGRITSLPHCGDICAQRVKSITTAGLTILLESLLLANTEEKEYGSQRLLILLL